MKRITHSARIPLIAAGLLFVGTAAASAQGLLGYHIIIEDPPPDLPLTIGVDDGTGMIFVRLNNVDDNAAPLFVPLGGRLAIGFDRSSTPLDIPGCDIWDLMGGQVTDGPIVVPLFQAVGTGATPGVDFGELMPPPLSLTAGQQFSVTDGALPGWPDIRLVDESSVADLEGFVREVDSLPDFTGMVEVSQTRIRFLPVPEPSTLAVSLIAIVVLVNYRIRR